MTLGTGPVTANTVGGVDSAGWGRAGRTHLFTAGCPARPHGATMVSVARHVTPLW